VLAELDLSRDNIFYSIVVGWLYALVGFISNFSKFNLCAGLSSLELLLFSLGLVRVIMIINTYCISIII
jgi:hypothetical protein